MSILTKICVVLVLVVSVAASGAFLRIVSVQRSWMNAYNKQKDRSDVAVLTAANDKIALQLVVTKLEAERANTLNQKKALADEQTAHSADKATDAQAAAVQGVSLATAKRDWAFAKVWLLREMTGSLDHGSERARR